MKVVITVVANSMDDEEAQFLLDDEEEKPAKQVKCVVHVQSRKKKGKVV